MQKLEKKALEYYNKENFPAALRSFLKLEPQDLERDDILVYIANCYDALEQKDEAVKNYKKALKKNKLNDVAYANLAIISYEMQDFSQAKKYADKAVKHNSQNISALSVLGNLFYQKKSYNQALKMYQQAMDIQRDYYTANFNTAGIYYAKKDFNTAYFYIKKTVQYHPNSVEAQNLLANICMEVGNYSEAKIALLFILQKNPKDFWSYNLLSQVYQHTKEYDKALEAGWFAIAHSFGEDAQHINFGYLLYEVAIEEPTAEVKKYASKWLEQYPDNPIALHMGNTIINAAHISHINSRFVREIFDSFADDFDDVLSQLDYSVPSLMSEFLDSLNKNTGLSKMRILDAGCGTGLCGQYLKKYAKFRGLDGVDISEKMLEKAEQRKLYTRLYNEDLTKFLQEHKNTYSLINAADVFTYFGDLENLFFFAEKSLRRTGRILFSISENNLNNEDYFLHVSGRFLHSKIYVENCLQKFRFSVERINRVKLRNEGETPVFGWIVMAQKR